MKLSELLEQCEVDDSSTIIAKRKLRYHAAEVLPALLSVIRTIVTNHNRYSSGEVGNCQCGTCKLLKPALAAAEDVQDVLAGGICDGMKDEPLHGDDDERDWDFNDQRVLEIKGMTHNELRREKVRLDRLMEEKRLIIQTASDSLSNLRLEKKRVTEKIFSLGSSDPPLDNDGQKQQQ